jgi:stearoyl-CoA 9-desaturase NADPH oxidoreductase
MFIQTHKSCTMTYANAHSEQVLEPQSVLPSRFQGLSRALQSSWLRPLNDPAFYSALRRKLNPLHEANWVGARVLSVTDETHDCKTFLLQSNQAKFAARWQGHRAGQHTTLRIALAGQYLFRTFTIASAPGGNGQIALTIKRSKGRANPSVSAWLFAHAKPGDLVHLSPASGQFCVPDAPCEYDALSEESGTASIPLLFITAGSGITPAMAILRSCAGKRSMQLIHTCKNAGDFIFARQLQALAAAHSNIKVHAHFTEEHGRMNASILRSLLSEDAKSQIFLCGPGAFAAMVQGAIAPKMPMIVESFGGPAAPAENAGAPLAVQFSKTKQVFTVTPGVSLLSALELAGAKPAFGCRIGICKTCQCLKRSGETLDLQTGLVHSTPNSLIQLCTTAAQGPLELAL